MSAVKLAAIVMAVIVAVTVAENNPFQPFTTLDAYPFVRLTNAEGSVGTSSEFQGESHALALANTESELSRFIQSPPRGTLALVLGAHLLTKENLERMRDKGHIRGLVVLAGSDSVDGFSSADPYPSKAEGLHPTSSHVWNTWGNGIRFQEYNFPIIGLTEKDSSHVQKLASANNNNGFGFPRNAIFIDSFMHASDDAETCLRRQLCQPLGGQSVWATFSKISANDTRESILLTATADGDGMFYRLAPGVNSAASGSIAVLAAAEALSKIPAIFSSSSKRVIVGLFTGESFGHIGSQRFVRDLQSFTCEKGKAKSAPGTGAGCEKPFIPDTSFTQVKLESIQAIIEAHMVGNRNSDASDPFFVHRESDTGSSSLADLVILQGEASGEKVLKAESVDGIPPSVSEAFLAAEPSISAVVFSEFNSSFTEKFYNSHLDHHVSSSRICKAANVLARSVAIYAIDGFSGDVSVNCTLVETIVDCFSKHLGCSFLQQYGFPSDFNSTTWTDESGHVNSYTSVFSPMSTATTPMATFARLFLAQVTTEGGPRGSCSDKDCQNLVNGKCIAGACYNGSSFFHRAVSPAFEYSGSTFELADNTKGMSTWTESNWMALAVKTHLLEDERAEIGFLFLGLILTVATIASTCYLRPRVHFAV